MLELLSPDERDQARAELRACVDGMDLTEDQNVELLRSVGGAGGASAPTKLRHLLTTHNLVTTPPTPEEKKWIAGCPRPQPVAPQRTAA